MEVSVKIRVDLKPLDQFLQRLTTPGRDGYDEVMLRWLIRYKKYAKAQFNKNSRGGGLWPSLKKSTRKRVRKRSRLILRDSDTISKTLDPIPTLDRNPSPGILTIRTPRGLKVLFGGGGKHPFSKLSIAKLCEVHHLGRGNNPSRIILIPASSEVKRRMKLDVQNVIKKTKQSLGMR
jgi:hypothetical protein